MPGKAWKQKTYKQAWQQGDTLSVGIGQGYVTATPLQLVQQAARMASGKAVSAAPGPFGGRQGRSRAPTPPSWISPTRRWRRVRSGMNKVMNEGGGTAYDWRIPMPGFEMAGKTGTAQVRVYTKRRACSAA